MTWIYVFFQNIFQNIEVTAHAYIMKIEFNKPLAPPDTIYYSTFTCKKTQKRIIASISNWPTKVHEKALVRLMLRSCRTEIFNTCLSSLLHIK